MLFWLLLSAISDLPPEQHFPERLNFAEFLALALPALEGLASGSVSLGQQRLFHDLIEWAAFKGAAGGPLCVLACLAFSLLLLIRHNLTHKRYQQDLKATSPPSLSSRSGNESVTAVGKSNCVVSDDSQLISSTECAPTEVRLGNYFR
jgi:hypothetical protein